ncbi:MULTISPECIES: hypothetical protein [Micrococcaceae]|uniref:Uncharacterized protein n=1 Tax=Pseudarthrobacter siccitolerans TaxID=861266 RepID=A0ABU0PK68_9MICC|nr:MULTISPECIES: hypothetical protein [Micrococcaceae]MDQ0674373.1 hypothetical protein [Pseudarthrobacter siccitolerans]MDQ0689433.1 hypothetical protein [Arthrobacter sp. W4I7]
MEPTAVHSWRRVSWNALPPGQWVRLSRDGQPLGCGVVDGATPDGSVIWVVMDGWPERRMFHRQDFVKVEIKG